MDFYELGSCPPPPYNISKEYKNQSSYDTSGHQVSYQNKCTSKRNKCLSPTVTFHHRFMFKPTQNQVLSNQIQLKIAEQLLEISHTAIPHVECNHFLLDDRKPPNPIRAATSASVSGSSTAFSF